MSPNITKNGMITEKITVHNGVLTIDDEEKFKFEDGKWYCGNSGEWVWLGILANPAFVPNGPILDRELFFQVFEEIEEEK